MYMKNSNFTLRTSHVFDPNSRVLFEDIQYMLGPHAETRWNDLALELLLPIDQDKLDAERASQARKLASGVGAGSSTSGTAPRHSAPPPPPMPGGPPPVVVAPVPLPMDEDEDEEEQEEEEDEEEHDENDESLAYMHEEATGSDEEEVLQSSPVEEEDDEEFDDDVENDENAVYTPYATYDH